MATDKKKIDEESNDSNSTLRAEGIIIEKVDPIQEKLEEEIEALQAEGEEKELFDAIGVEIPKKSVELEEPEADQLKKDLNKGGVELLPTEPLGDEEL